MTTGAKIAKLRKEASLTQEQLAESLNVSRQSVSKWESDIAFPETEKIIELGKMFSVSTDYLLTDNENTVERKKYYEFISDKKIGKLPLIHITTNPDTTAKGFIAIGLKARGIISIGILSIGVLSFGAVSIGALAFGALALGMLTLGAFSIGLIAIGAIAIGLFSLGAISIGLFSGGAISIGYYVAVGDIAYSNQIGIGCKSAAGSIYAISSGESGKFIHDSEFTKSLIDEKIPGWQMFKDFIKALL